MADSLDEYLEDEWYLVRHSGETPEIALHSALYFLTRAKDGPRATLSLEQISVLQRAAVDRFSEIILRDLQHDNCGTASYRGIGRSIINFRRFCSFCERQKIASNDVCKRTADALRVFLAIEMAELGRGERKSVINCTYNELHVFAGDLQVDLLDTFPDIAAYCLPVV